MTPAEFRAARKALGLTQHGLAEALRMGKWGFQSVAKWEKGVVPVPGPAAVAMELMLDRVRIARELDGIKLAMVNASADWHNGFNHATARIATLDS